MPPSALRNSGHNSVRLSQRAEDVALSAVRNLDRAIAVIAPDGTVLLSNRACADIFGPDATGPTLLGLLGDRTDLFAASGRGSTMLPDGRAVLIETTPIPQGILLTAEDVSASLAERERATREARTDALTGLANRAAFREHLSTLAATADRSASVAVLMIDLDRFKTVNDSLGHPVGDDLLRVVGERLRSVLGTGDMAYRLGGDEFCIVQAGGEQPKAAAALGERVVDLIGRTYLVEGHLINIGASVGIALLPQDGADYGEIVKAADLALLQAKQDGRGRFKFFESRMDAQMQARRQLEIDLRRALALREFSLVYQPQFNIGSRQITGFEALLRWRHPVRGLVSPATFIPIAEEIGLIVPIGEWVIRTACREAARWEAPLGVAVNVSAVQFRTSTLVPTVVSALAESGIDPSRLEIELTESVLMGDHEAALSVLRSLRDLGVRVSMDDFGTGYSSLSYLRSFPFDKIKIDQCFVRGRGGDEQGMAIVRAIAALGQSLGMTTTAEGVETEEQLARIAADGCTDAQGYLISRPLPPEEIAAFLDANAGRGPLSGRRDP